MFCRILLTGIFEEFDIDLADPQIRESAERGIYYTMLNAPRVILAYLNNRCVRL